MVYFMQRNEKDFSVVLVILFIFDVVLFLLQISCFYFLIVLFSSVLQPEHTYLLVYSTALLEYKCKLESQPLSND